MRSLARGAYSFRILGVNGLSTRAPVALSKDQTVVAKVISYLDLAVVGLAGVLLAVGLFAVGRLSLRRSASRGQESGSTRLPVT